MCCFPDTALCSTLLPFLDSQGRWHLGGLHVHVSTLEDAGAISLESL